MAAGCSYSSLVRVVASYWLLVTVIRRMISAPRRLACLAPRRHRSKQEGGR